MKSLLLMIMPLILSCTTEKIEDCDLLKSYGEQHKYLDFIECHQGEGQVIKYSTYKVAGTHSSEVEKYLVETYGMAKLKFTCCGWEPQDGKYGEIINPELKKMNKDYHLSVTMIGNAEKINDSTYIEKDRNEIDFFYVTVRLLKV